MSNDYYERKAELEPFTTARSDDVRNELDAVQSAFEKLPQPRQDGTKGFLTAFTIVTPTNPDEPATNAQVTTEKNKNTEQDGRLDNVENALTGLGPVDGRFTTLRYVASEGQTQIVLPAQFQSLAYVHKNGARLYQTVGFDYDIATKTITFTNSLALSDEVLVDVGVVPDAVLADLIAIQTDIANRQNDVIQKHQDVVTKHQDVTSMHGDVNTWKQQVSQDKNTTVEAKDEANATYALLQQRHLGSHATPPTTDNEGNPLIEGASYYNNTSGKSYAYEQGTWVVTNLSETTTTSKTSLTGATVLPAGQTADRPDPAQLTPNQAYIRANTDLDEFEGIIVGQTKWGSIAGGGMTKPLPTSDLVITAKRNSAIEVNLADNQPRAINIPAGWAVGSYYIVQTANWTGNPAANVVINLDQSEQLDLPASYGIKQKLLIKGGETVALMKTAQGKYAIAESQPNMRAVKKGKTVLYDNGEATGVVPLSQSMLLFDELRIYASLNNGVLGTPVTVDPEELLDTSFSSSLVLVSFLSPNNSNEAMVDLNKTATTETSLSISTQVQTWTSCGIYKVIGIKY